MRSPLTALTLRRSSESEASDEASEESEADLRFLLPLRDFFSFLDRLDFLSLASFLRERLRARASRSSSLLSPEEGEDSRRRRFFLRFRLLAERDSSLDDA